MLIKNQIQIMSNVAGYSIIQKLQQNIQTNLPGEAAHLPMSPLGRGRSSILMKNVDTYKLSSVAVIIYPNQYDFQIILTQRATYQGVHSGQISFPGGREEPFDKLPINTAIRETKEEINLDLLPSEFLGNLTNVFIPVSNFLVRPFVFFLPEQPLFQNNYEVTESFSIPFSTLLDEKVVQLKTVTVAQNYQMKVPCFFVNDKIIWGATAIILNEFKMILQNIEPYKK